MRRLRGRAHDQLLTMEGYDEVLIEKDKETESTIKRKEKGWAYISKSENESQRAGLGSKKQKIGMDNV